MTRILSIGEIMMEMSDMGGGLYRKSFAGDTFNMAHYIRLVSGGRIDVDYLTAIGQDTESDDCLKFMQKEGVGTDRVFRDANRTIGLFILSNDPKGEKQYGYWRGQSAARFLFDQPHDLSGYELVYLSGITAAITEQKNNLVQSVSQARHKGGFFAFDLNYRPKLWSITEAEAFADQILPLMGLVKISDEE
ncbi:MAG: PfkB family carbohydrate kinase, partial [Sneathiella sp.]